MEERYKSKIVVDLLLERNNEFNNKKEILLLLRQNTGHADGMYDLPGGHVEPNEDLFESMIREAKEEIGIEILRKDLKIIHIYHHFQKDVIKFLFFAQEYSNNIVNNEPDKCAELKWFNIDNLPGNIIPKIKDEIEFVKNNTYYSYDFIKVKNK